MLRCKDGSLYTGMTNHIEKRLQKHTSGTGAKYTKSHPVEKVEAVWKSKEKSLACKLEYQLKQLTKKQKEDIVQGEKLSTYLSGKVDCRRYSPVKVRKENWTAVCFFHTNIVKRPYLIYNQVY